MRAQVIDYSSICEALLADLIVQAYRKNKLAGAQQGYFDVRQKRVMNWNAADPFLSVHSTTFEWRILVASESGIIDAALAAKLNTIRTRRNTVHLTLKVMTGVSYYAGLAKRTHESMHELIRQTAAWVVANP